MPGPPRGKTSQTRKPIAVAATCRVEDTFRVTR